MQIQHGALILDGVPPELLGEPVTVTFRTKDGASVERTVLFTTQGFIESSLLDKRVVSQEPGVAPVIQTLEHGYFFNGEKVRQDVEIQVESAVLGAADGKIG